MALPNNFNDNSPTYAPPSTVGFKVSKPGYNAQRTGGQNMVFDSSWPSLPIAFETVVTNTITSSGSASMVIPHNLGFAPFTVAWAYGPDASGIGNVGTRFFPNCDTTNVTIVANLTRNCRPPYNATQIKIRCFQLDLTKDIDYILAPGDTFSMPYDPNFGVKITKPGKNIASTDMRDFSLHSRCQSPLILAVKTEKTMTANVIQTGPSTFSPTNVVQYTSKLKYPVWAYGLARLSASHSYQFAPLYTQQAPKTFSDGFTTYIDFDGAAYEGATVVVLRDPMFAATQQTVQY